MKVPKIKCWKLGAAAVLAVAALPPAAQAQDFFSGFFGGFGRPHAPAIQMPSGEEFQRAQPRQRFGGGQAWCVRICDGRYFPITGNGGEARANSCENLCPTADTEIVYGNTIDNAATEKGKPYSKLPNAFRYRNELVAGCSCNGKDPAGLASIDVERDPTLRKGDIVAGENDLVVANKSADGRGAPIEFSPASERIKARYRPPPVVAKGRD
ncbi:DUF2865 domain-containing protein [Bradyrhizobium sp.]|uniref:DUF2865 domain-containing protein n=1 Tax=Bradyrhizobium sp. TaxID=376 RepID=UPI001D28F9D9|nr:DUF2865 domain-containing protein [Bradyrhizobium sp.]MBI5321521.1 DUF2865 domain-containing protein [Bradyrhizobium sp.]